MATAADLLVKIGLDSEELQKGLDGVQKTLNGMSDKFSKAGKTLSLAFTTPIVAIGAVAYKAFGEVDDAMDTIRAGTGATGKTLQELGDSFKKVFANVPSSAGEAGTAIADLNTRLGLTGPNLEKVATQVLNLSRITKTDLATNIASLTGMMNAWGISSDKVSEKMDFLWKVSQATGISISQLSDISATFAPYLQELGFSFDQAAVLLGKMEQNGMPAVRMMSTLRNGLAQITKAGQTGAEAFKEISEKIKNAKDSTEAAKIAMDVFGNSGIALAEAIRSGKLEVENFAQELDKNSETINKSASDTADFAEKFQTLKNRATLALAPIGAMLSDIGIKIADKVIPLVEKFTNWWNNLGEGAQRNILIIAGLLASTGPLCLAISGVIKAINGIISAFAFLTSPTGLVILGIAAIALAVYEIMTHWEQIKAFFSALWETIKNIFSAAWEGIKSIWTTVADWFSANVIEPLKAFWQTLTDFFAGLWEGIRTGASEVWNAIVVWFNDNIVTPIKEIWTTLIDFFANLWETIKNAVLGAWEAIKNGVKAVFDTIVGWIETVIEKLKNLWNWLTNTQGVNQGGVYAPYNPQYVPPQETWPGRQLGGPVMAKKAYIVGERGPELFMPNTSGVILPHLDLMKAIEALEARTMRIEQKIQVEVATAPDTFIQLMARGVKVNG